jgi:hypothetical protein
LKRRRDEQEDTISDDSKRSKSSEEIDINAASISEGNSLSAGADVVENINSERDKSVDNITQNRLLQLIPLLQLHHMLEV